MNIVSTLTVRHIKAHKKRSILTIAAITVSVAMVTAVFTGALSFINYFRNVALAVDGSWHSCVTPDNYTESIEVFKSDTIDTVGISLPFGDAKISEDDTDFKMNISAVDKYFLELKNVKITDGRMPENSSELLVHNKFSVKNKLNWQVGDKITLTTLISEESEDIEYTVTGLTDSNVYETDVTDAFTFAEDSLTEGSGDVNVYIRFNKLDNSVYLNSEDICRAVRNDGIDRIVYNSSLLTYSGISTDDITPYIMVAFCAVILLIIAAVSVLMIYDSFAVSYQERSRYLGMLASVGATKKQKRASIYFEGFILGLIAIPLGIITGIGGLALTFRAISDVWISTLSAEYDGALSVSVNWAMIFGTVAASACTIFLSCYMPARKASKTTAIDAIRQSDTVKISKAQKIKTPKLAYRIFGYEGVLAVKNYKRNGRRSKTTVFALFMSTVVFLSVTNFSLMFNKVMQQTFSKNADMNISVSYTDADKLNTALSRADGLKDVYCIDYEYAGFDKSLINPDVTDLFTNEQIILAFVDNATLDTYLEQLGENTEKYHDNENPTAVLHNTAVTRDDKKKIKVEPLIDVEGKKLETEMNVFNTETGTSEEAITIAPTVGIQTTEDYKNDLFYFQDMHLPLLVLSIDFAPQYFKQSEIFKSTYHALITCDNPDEAEDDFREFILPDAGIKDYNIYNATSEMKAVNNILAIVKIFVFGFITLITLISVLNIINTISSSMNERRREFAMIRSVGMTPEGFKKMVYYENFRYGLVSLLWAIPVSTVIHVVMYLILSRSYDYGFTPHISIYFIAAAAVFAVIILALIYSLGKIKEDNIIDTIKLDIS